MFEDTENVAPTARVKEEPRKAKPSKRTCNNVALTSIATSLPTVQLPKVSKSQSNAAVDDALGMHYMLFYFFLFHLENLCALLP